MALGLALSGGGAKGAAHIGVLQALKEENINIDYISGTSSGSIVATLYACGYTPYQILSIFNNFCGQIFDFDTKLLFKAVGKIFNSRRSITSLSKGENLENIVKYNCRKKGVENINQIKLPVAIPTVDINENETVYFLNNNIGEAKNIYYSGNISTIVRASCSYPVIFEPKIYKRRLLVDGGLKENVPVSILNKMGADRTIAVCFDEKLPKLYDMDIVNVGLRCLDIMGADLAKNEIKKANFVIRPRVSKINMLDCSKINIAANEGYYATKENIEYIKEMIN